MCGHASYALGTATKCPFSRQADRLTTGTGREGQKKRPYPKIGPDDWAEAKSKVGQRAREEEMRSAMSFGSREEEMIRSSVLRYLLRREEEIEARLSNGCIYELY